MIKVENLIKYFGRVKAVDGISFEVKQGEVVGFLGPNGAGKTTTMRMLSGFLSADGGKISFGGKLIEDDIIKAQKQIGYLPENNPLYKDMLVSEFLELSAELNNIPKEKKMGAFDFAVSSTGIKEIFYRPIKELSKGFKQRVGIAAAILHKPSIIMMDEPTEGLDPNQRAEIRSLIRKLSKDHTIIISTHVMQEASAVCDRMLIINKGKIIADGTTDELSRTGENEQSIFLDVEGCGVEQALQNVAGIKRVEIKNTEGNRIQAEIIADNSVKIQPDISRLIGERHWVVWKLSEKERELEDIFRSLTK